MTQEIFILRFNKGNAKDRSDLFRECDLREADYTGFLPAPPGYPEKSVAFVVAGYKKVQAGIWYMINGEKRLPVAAFPICKKAVDTYQEWKKTVPDPYFAEMYRKHVIEAFSNTGSFIQSAN